MLELKSRKYFENLLDCWFLSFDVLFNHHISKNISVSKWWCAPQEVFIGRDGTKEGQGSQLLDANINAVNFQEAIIIKNSGEWNCPDPFAIDFSTKDFLILLFQCSKCDIGFAQPESGLQILDAVVN